MKLYAIEIASTEAIPDDVLVEHVSYALRTGLQLTEIKSVKLVSKAER